MTTPAVDWQALEFTCSHEKDAWPKVDTASQAEAWFQEGLNLHEAGVKKGNADFLRRGFELTSMAAERKHVLAMNNMVVFYLAGHGAQASDDKAVEWAEKLIELNVGMGYYHMGAFLQQGIGVRQDHKAALTYFRKAADLGNAQGQLAAGGKLLEAFAQSPRQGERARHRYLDASLRPGAGTGSSGL